MKLLQDMTIPEMEQELGFHGEIRRDLADKSYEVRKMKLAEEGIVYTEQGEAYDAETEKPVSLLEADRQPEPIDKPEVEQPIEEPRPPDNTWGREFTNNFVREAYGR